MKINSPATPKLKKYVMRSVLAIVAVFMAFNIPMQVFADNIDDQIRQIESEIAGYQAEAGRLRSEADTLQNATNVLTAQKNAIQAQVNLSQAKYDQLITDIAANELKLAKNQSVLSATISDLSVESVVSPIEILASSQSIGDFIDGQEYLSSVQEQIESSIKEIKTLKTKLASQKKEVELVLADQKSQRDAVAAKEAEQSALLAATQGQEAAYQSMTGQKTSQIASLRAQQRAANATIGGSAVAGDPGRGGYPNAWYNAPMDSLVDDWGMYNRECVSYTAWKVHQAGKHMPYWGGYGDAKQWPGNAQAEGIPTSNQPRVGTVAVAPNTGPYGHVMWVEEVYSDGSIYVSQFNYAAPGEYSEMRVSAGTASNFVYIYF